MAGACGVLLIICDLIVLIIIAGVIAVQALQRIHLLPTDDVPASMFHLCYCHKSDMKLTINLLPSRYLPICIK